MNEWYENKGFLKVDSYLHVFMDSEKELKEAVESRLPQLFPISAFAHYIGAEKETIKKQFRRVHECRCFEKKLVLAGIK
ncbi:hypothetical protein [Bacillus sp. 1P06AnD]|uniref:hypothetical protein n=1 Tax=Bacillus sp. 1P06AnD TaxID=3132208 RepID=UPI0039A15941